MCCRFCWQALVGAMIGGLLFVACTTTKTSPVPSDTSPTSPTTSGMSVTTTKPYGSLRIGVEMGQGALDPQISFLGAWWNLAFPAIYDPLVLLSPEQKLEPGIAERWTISPDGLTHTFFIRRGVKFHDGSDLTGADVKFSIERAIEPQSIWVYAPSWRGAVARVELKDDFTVALHMKQPQHEELVHVFGVFIVPKKYIEERGVDYFRKNPIGSGAWRFVRIEPGLRLELEAVESHWRKVPEFKNITVLDVPEEATKISMLKTGELDMALVGPDSVPTVKSAGLRVFSYDGGRQIFGQIFYDLEHPEQYALGDVRARKALFWAINRKELVDTILRGGGGAYALFKVSPKADFFDPNVLKPDPYDPEGAKKLLAEAGYSDGFSTKIWNDRGTFNGTIGQAVAGYWRKVGVRAEVVPIESATLNSMFIPKQKPEIWNSIRLLDIGVESLGFEGMASQYHSTKSAAKNIKNPRLDELIDKVPQTADPGERKRLALEAAVLAYNEYSILRVAGVDMTVAAGAKIGEVPPYRYSLIVGIQFERITHAK